MTGSSCLTSSRTEPGSYECSAGHLEVWCTLPGFAPNLHFTEEAPLNSILQQACVSGNLSDGGWVKFSQTGRMWPLEKEGKINVLYRRKGSQTELYHLQLMGPLWLGLFGRANSRFFPWSTGWLGQSGPDVPAQRSKELVSPHAKRKDKVFHGKVCLGNNWVSFV